LLLKGEAPSESGGLCHRDIQDACETRVDSQKTHRYQNAAIMEQEGYEAKKEVKRLKQELMASRKIIKEFQKISTTPLNLQKQTSFHE